MSDLISRSKLIEFLENRTGEFADDTGIGWNSGIETAIRVVEKFPSVEQKSDWINVKDRLPRSCEVVVTCNRYGDMNIAYYTAGEFYYGDFYYYDHLRGVTHWMPLPEPPKGENDG